MQGNIKCPLESVYVEDSFVGFSVKTTHRGQFVATEGVKVLKCDGWRTQAVTHKDRRAKAFVQIVFWPYNYYDEDDEPEFEIILVKDKDAFWTGIKV